MAAPSTRRTAAAAATTAAATICVAVLAVVMLKVASAFSPGPDQGQPLMTSAVVLRSQVIHPVSSSSGGGFSQPIKLWSLARTKTPSSAPPAAAPTTAAAAAAGAPDAPGSERRRMQRHRPVVVAHRGASGVLPEHTAPAYELAIQSGADFIECDVQLTKDLEMICRHEQNLNDTTDAAEKFPERVKTYVIDGEASTGVHSIDLTLSEVRTLRARQRFPMRDQSHNGRYPLVTFSQFLDIVAGAPRAVGVYPEVKHPTWHNGLQQVQAAGTTIQRMVVDLLHSRGYGGGGFGTAEWRRRPVYVQSFEMGSIRNMHSMTAMPLVLLMGGWPGYRAPDSGMTHEEMTRPDALKEAARYLSGVGPWKGSLMTVVTALDSSIKANTTSAKDATQQQQQEQVAGLSVDAAHDSSHSGTGGRLVSTGLVSQLKALGLQVHPYTLRDEPQFVPSPLAGSVARELSELFDAEGVDGVFADYPATAIGWFEARERAPDGAVAAAAAAAAPAPAPALAPGKVPAEADFGRRDEGDEEGEEEGESGQPVPASAWSGAAALSSLLAAVSAAAPALA